MRGLQDHFPLSYKEVDEVVHLIADCLFWTGKASKRSK